MSIGVDEEQVRDALEGEGLAGVRVWDGPGQLPGDWPPDRRGDESEGEYEQAWVEASWDEDDADLPASGRGWQVYDVWEHTAEDPLEVLHGWMYSKCARSSGAMVDEDGVVHTRIGGSAPVVAKMGDAGDRTSQYRQEIEAAAEFAGIPPALLAGLVASESRGRPDVVSSRGATGLTQMLASTARWASDPAFPGRTDGHPQPTASQMKDPAWNLRYGARFLRWCIDKEEGNVLHALARYNAGSAKCGTARGCTPNPWRLVVGCYKPEMLDYVTKVLARWNWFVREEGMSGLPVRGGSGVRVFGGVQSAVYAAAGAAAVLAVGIGAAWLAAKLAR
jgi:hypothetical protein